MTLVLQYDQELIKQILNLNIKLGLLETNIREIMTKFVLIEIHVVIRNGIRHILQKWICFFKNLRIRYLITP